MIEFKNVYFRYDQNYVFKDFSFKINQNQKVCFTGKSGKGKSTLIKLLNGFETIESGKIWINNIELIAQNLDEIRKDVVWIPQNINLPVNSGKELASLLNATKNKLIILEFLVKLGLTEDYLEKPFDSISIGQKQRIVIAICLSIDSKFIIMDEPTASLDEESINLLINAIQTIKDKTLVSTSHNLSWIKSSDKEIKL